MKLLAQEISLWSVDENGNRTEFVGQKANVGWTPMNVHDNKLLWVNNTTNRISISVYDENFKQTVSKGHGPFAGWHAVNYSDDRILWANDNGSINLWRIDDGGEKTSEKKYGPFQGWHVVNYSMDKILWVHDDGRIDLWTVDYDGNKIGSKVHRPESGWTPVNCYGFSGHILWEQEDGRVSLWTLDEKDNRISFKNHNPPAGFRVINYANGTILWANPDGRFILSSVQYDGTLISNKNYTLQKDWRVINCSDNKLLVFKEKAAPPPPKPAPTVSTANAKEYYVKNYWTNTYLFGGQDFGCGGKTPNMTANNWVFLPVNGLKNTYQIRHKESGNFLHIEKGFLDFGKIQSGWSSAQWILEPLPNFGENVYRIKNRLKPTLYLNNEKVAKSNGIECTVSNPNFHSSRWYLEGDE
jgi:hypothetical protein